MQLLQTLMQKITGRNTANRQADYWIFGTVLFFASTGLLSAFILSVEKLELIKDPNAVLSCSVNIWLNCASVMKTWQAELLGFPNSYIGLMAYPVIITLAMAKLMGAMLPRNFMFGAQIGALVGVIFAYWLFFNSVFVIQVLCPWCLVVTFSTTMIFEALLRYNIRENNLYLPASLQAAALKFIKADYDKLVVAGWIVVLVVTVFMKFRGAV